MAPVGQLLRAAKVLEEMRLVRAESVRVVEWSQTQRQLRDLWADANSVYETLRALQDTGGDDDDDDGTIRDVKYEARSIRGQAKALMSRYLARS